MSSATGSMALTSSFKSCITFSQLRCCGWISSGIRVPYLRNGARRGFAGEPGGPALGNRTDRLHPFLREEARRIPEGIRDEGRLGRLGSGGPSAPSA